MTGFPDRFLWKEGDLHFSIPDREPTKEEIEKADKALNEVIEAMKMSGALGNSYIPKRRARYYFQAIMASHQTRAPDFILEGQHMQEYMITAQPWTETISVFQEWLRCRK